MSRFRLLGLGLERRRAIRVKRRTNSRRLRGLLYSFALLAAYPALAASAMTAAPLWFAAFWMLAYCLEIYLHRHEGKMLKRLGQLRASLPVRVGTRGIFLIALLAFSETVDEQVFKIAVVALPSWIGIQALYAGELAVIKNRRTLPVVTRGIDLTQLRIPSGPFPWLVRNPGRRMIHQELFLIAGTALWALTGSLVWLVTGVACALAVAVGLMLLALPALTRSFRVPSPAAVTEATESWLAHYGPDTVLYFSGDQGSAFQANMWLETLERTAERPLVLIRERYLVDQLDPTTIPVLCLPAGVDVMNIEMPTVTTALYTTNVGKNVHFVRRPGVRHVFIGHGDSDKTASVTPVSRMYDEIWVAGPAARERYDTSGIGVPDEEMIEVGRPQLDSIYADASLQRTPGRIPTVLYAPTWEGWSELAGATSVLDAGENLVRRLLDSPTPVRVIYRPHPYTGRRDAQVRKAHQRIIALLEQDNHQRGKDPQWRATAQEGAQERDEAWRLHQDLEQRLSRLGDKLHWTSVDEATSSYASASPDTSLCRLYRKERDAWEQAYWDSFGPWEHHAILDGEPRLYSCFDQADMLIGDISSVLSDFIATLKPYAVVNNTLLGDEEFRDAVTNVRAAYLLPASGDGLLSLVRALYDPARDVLAEHRVELRRYLLGDESVSATERFRRAVHQEEPVLEQGPRQVTIADLLGAGTS
ncbi:hypothetical protein [Streptomyces fractus]|uniref:hypothetical protein n=1 Tax=Streptomyces fractus TaxID=641806 RepID=UPI003CFA916A